MRIGGRIHRIWGWYSEFGYWLPEEKPRWWPTRLNEWAGQRSGPPLWVWRPLCWLRRHHEDNSYGSCVICWKRLA